MVQVYELGLGVLLAGVVKLASMALMLAPLGLFFVIDSFFDMDSFFLDVLLDRESF